MDTFGYYWNPTGGPLGTGAWEKMQGIDGAAHVTDPLLTTVVYAGSGYTYICKAPMGTARSTAGWQIARFTDSNGDKVFAGAVGSTVGTFAFAATDLATVAAHTYTLGA